MKLIFDMKMNYGEGFFSKYIAKRNICFVEVSSKAQLTLYFSSSIIEHLNSHKRTMFRKEIPTFRTTAMCAIILLTLAQMSMTKKAIKITDLIARHWSSLNGCSSCDLLISQSNPGNQSITIQENCHYPTRHNFSLFSKRYNTYSTILYVCLSQNQKATLICASYFSFSKFKAIPIKASMLHNDMLYCSLPQANFREMFQELYVLLYATLSRKPLSPMWIISADPCQFCG